jgi:hypothetical protein
MRSIRMTRPTRYSVAHSAMASHQIAPAERRGHFCRVIGEVGEAAAAVVFVDAGYTLFEQITTPGIHGVDLLFITPDEAVVALEVKGTLRPGAIPRLTSSLRRQMSRDV